MSRSKWLGLRKVSEECAELVVELMKLATFPKGKHPGRKRSLVVSTEEELADVIAACDYFIDRNKLNRVKIEKRKALKYKKFSGWWGEPKAGVVVKIDNTRKAKRPKTK